MGGGKTIERASAKAVKERFAEDVAIGGGGHCRQGSGSGEEEGRCCMECTAVSITRDVYVGVQLDLIPMSVESAPNSKSSSPSSSKSFVGEPTAAAAPVDVCGSGVGRYEEKVAEGDKVSVAVLG